MVSLSLARLVSPLPLFLREEALAFRDLGTFHVTSSRGMPKLVSARSQLEEEEWDLRGGERESSLFGAPGRSAGECARETTTQ